MPELEAYYSDRILRAVARGDSMNTSQKKDLAAEILSKVDPKSELAKAATDLVADKLTEAAVVALYSKNKVEGFDPGKYRESQAPASDSKILDKKISALLEATK